MNGKLVELNDALVKEPSLAVTQVGPHLATCPCSPSVCLAQRIKSDLITRAQARVKGFVAMLVLKKWAAADLKKELKLAT